MTCDEFEVQLQEVLDRRAPLAGDPFLDRHAKDCAACHRKIRLYEALFDGLDLAETPSLADDFSKQISRAAKVRRPIRWKTILSTGAAIAASLLVMVALARHLNSPAAPATDSLTSTNPPAEGNRTIKPRNRQAGGPNALVSNVTPGPKQPANPPVQSDNSPTQKELDELIRELQFASQNLSLAETSAATTRLPGFRPLASSLTTAFTALRQTLPGGRSEEQPPAKPQARLSPLAETRTV